MSFFTIVSLFLSFFITLNNALPLTIQKTNVEIKGGSGNSYNSNRGISYVVNRNNFGSFGGEGFGTSNMFAPRFRIPPYRKVPRKPSSTTVKTITECNPIQESSTTPSQPSTTELTKEQTTKQQLTDIQKLDDVKKSVEQQLEQQSAEKQQLTPLLTTTATKSTPVPKQETSPKQESPNPVQQTTQSLLLTEPTPAPASQPLFDLLNLLETDEPKQTLPHPLPVKEQPKQQLKNKQKLDDLQKTTVQQFKNEPTKRQQLPKMPEPTEAPLVKQPFFKSSSNRLIG